MARKVYVNRTLNLKKIRYIGLDMDHTLVRYNSENFEKLSHAKDHRQTYSAARLSRGSYGN
jgi:hypothetical protein